MNLKNSDLDMIRSILLEFRCFELVEKKTIHFWIQESVVRSCQKRKKGQQQQQNKRAL